MYQVIKAHCESNKTNGLFLLDMPTGSGKTYAVFKYIFDACRDEENKDRRYFFITPLKKNLPVNSMRKLFEDAGMLTAFNEKFLFIDSNDKSARENYSSELAKSIPEEIAKTNEYKRFKREVEFLQKHEGSKDSAVRMMFEDAENKFRKETEPAFRKLIQRRLRAEYSTVSRRLLAVKTEKKWKWVGKLYPAVFTQDRQILFMSMDKFLVKNSVIVEPSYQFYSSKLIKNAVIFIDEFDSAKAVMLKSIIQNGLDDRLPLAGFFRSVYSAMKTNDFPADLTTPSEHQKKSKYNKSYLESIISNTREMAEERYKLYSLQYSHRTDEDAEDRSRNFLFQDHRSISVLNDKAGSIVSETDHKRRINALHFTAERPQHDEQNVRLMLGQLRGFKNWFQTMVNILAVNYSHLKNERRKDGEEEITLENAVRSVLSLFNLSEKEIDHLTAQIMVNNRGSKSSRAAGSKFDRTFYEQGFCYYSLENDPAHDMQSRIMMCAFGITPEKLLVRFCERAKVIGLSATATVPTVIGNFDLDYLRHKLQGAFCVLSSEERERLRQDFLNSQSGYENIRIHTELISSDDCSLQTWEEIMQDKELAEEAFNCIEQKISGENSSHMKKRYVRISKAYKAFLQHEDIRSMLCLLTKHPAKDDEALDIDLLKHIFEFTAGSRDTHTMYLKGEDFEDNKKELLARLAEGEKLFVISAYQTIGAGQNLQYTIPSDLRGKLVCSNDRSPGNEKDFDAVYLDKPTNLLVRLEKDMKEEDFVKYLFQTEFLQENGELTQYDSAARIKRAFQCYSSGAVPKNGSNSNVYEKKSVRAYASGVVIQAVGRICRTNMKNPDIYIFADDRLANSVDLSVTKDRILNREAAALFEKLRKEQTRPPVPSSPEQKAELDAERAGMYIDSLRYEWSVSHIETWKQLRQFTLTYPTASAQQAENEKDMIITNFYVRQPHRSNVLYYSQEEDFHRLKIAFSRSPSACSAEDEAGTRLDRLMKWQALREHFISKGYAVTFEPNDYIMSPPLWNNIYKGALGEEAGRFWFGHVTGTELEELTDPEEFELFDFKVPETQIYTDFKNWSENTKDTDQELKEELDKIQGKAEKCGCKCVIIANILTKAKYPVRRFTQGGIEILILSSLLTDNNGSISIDKSAAEAVRRCLDDFADKN